MEKQAALETEFKSVDEENKQRAAQVRTLTAGKPGPPTRSSSHSEKKLKLHPIVSELAKLKTSLTDAEVKIQYEQITTAVSSLYFHFIVTHLSFFFIVLTIADQEQERAARRSTCGRAAYIGAGTRSTRRRLGEMESGVGAEEESVFNVRTGLISFVPHDPFLQTLAPRDRCVGSTGLCCAR